MKLSNYTFFYKQLPFSEAEAEIRPKVKQLWRNIKYYQKSIASNERTHSGKSFKHVFVVGATLFLSPL